MKNTKIMIMNLKCKVGFGVFQCTEIVTSSIYTMDIYIISLRGTVFS